MSVLTKKQILQEVEKGELRFKPSLDKFQLQLHSVDLRLGYTFLIPRKWCLTGRGRVASNTIYGEANSDHFETLELEEGQFFDFLPNEFVVVTTLEKIKLPLNIMAIIYPRSSLNRQGLSIDLSGIVDAGYEGNLVIPLRNNTSSQIVRLYPGQRFCQLVFSYLQQPVRSRQKSRYHRKDVVVGVLKERYPREVRLIKKGMLRELKERFKIE